MGKIIGKNKKAYFDYEIIKDFEAGIVLEGWEVKSIKEGNISLKESHISQFKGELWIYNMYVSPWKYMNSSFEMNEIRPRKLLLHKKEINYLMGQEKIAGLTIIPLDIHLHKGNIKVKLALVKGLKKGDKRQKIKEKEQKREIERDLKRIGY